MSNTQSFLLAFFSWGKLLTGCLLLCVSNIGFSGPSGTASRASDPYSHQAIAKKNYHVVTLNILALDISVLGEPVALHDRDFESR